MDPTASAANTHVLAHAGRIWALEEGHLPVRAVARARHARLRRLRRPADDRLHGPPQAVPGDRRAALLRLRRAAAVPHVPRARRHRRARPLGADHRARADDDARLHDHEGPRHLHGPARRVRPREGDAAARRRSRWDDDYGARVGIVPRFGTDADVRWFDVDPCYVFHPMNAYVDGSTGRLRRRPPRVDVAASRWTTSRRRTSTAGRSTSTRARSPRQQLDDVSHAFPRVDDRVVGLRHRYGWAARPAAGDRARSATPGVVVKYDLGDRARACSTSGRTPIPASSCSCGRRRQRRGRGLGDRPRLRRHHRPLRPRRSSTPTDPAAEPVARVHLPRRVPYGFHGSWISDAELPGSVVMDDWSSAAWPAECQVHGDCPVGGTDLATTASRRLGRLTASPPAGAGSSPASPGCRR